MKKWFTSDHHFWHGNIVNGKLCNDRKEQFGNLENMHEELIKRWNSVVGEHDIVYHLGDFSFRRDVGLLRRLVQRLNGRIILILGNHDQNEARRYMEAGFYDVTWHKRINLQGYRLMLQHYPRFPWITAKAGKADIIVHGHTHVKEKYKEAGEYCIWNIVSECDEIHYEDAKIHIGVDAWDFYPVEDLQIIALCDKLIGKSKEGG